MYISARKSEFSIFHGEKMLDFQQLKIKLNEQTVEYKTRNLSRYISCMCHVRLYRFLSSRSYSQDQDVFYHLAHVNARSLVRSRRYRSCENKCPGHTYIHIPATGATARINGPACHFDRSALKATKKSRPKSPRYRRRSDEIEKREEIPNNHFSERRSFLSHPSHAPSTKSPSFFVREPASQ